jgi:GDP-L-fucose synthase
MEKSSKIYVAGHLGLVGSAITQCLKQRGYNNLVFRTFSELNLIDQNSVDSFFASEKPEYVFLAAALVGGIQANNTLRADFIYQNIMVQSNVIHASWKNKVKKLLFLGSTCIYPKNAPQPLREEYLLSSQLEYTNEPYAVAKISGIKMCESFNIQYGTNFISVMPTNLYGPGDNYDLEKSHVLPALLRKIHLGKCLEEANWTAIRKDLEKYPVEKIKGGSPVESILNMLRKHGIHFVDEGNQGVMETQNNPAQKKHYKVAVNVWGTGTPLREFMYSLDMAEACVYIMEKVGIRDIIELNKSSVDRKSTRLNSSH